MLPEDRARALRMLAEDQAVSWRSIVEGVDRLVAAGAPRRTLLAAITPGLEPTRAFAATKDWARMNRTGILILSGSVGVGKSVAAARYALDTRATWAHAPSLGLEEYGRAARLVERLVAARHLVLDELGGQGSTSPAAVARISNVLVRRQAAGRPVVATTNLDIGALALAYDGVDSPEKSRLVDRVREGGAYVECRRERSFRVSGGVDPELPGNPYRVAREGLRIVGLIDAGFAASTLLDTLQQMLGCSDDEVLEASATSGLTPEIQGHIAALLEKTQPEARTRPVTCCSAVAQSSSDACGQMEAIS